MAKTTSRKREYPKPSISDRELNLVDRISAVEANTQANHLIIFKAIEHIDKKLDYSLERLDKKFDDSVGAVRKDIQNMEIRSSYQSGKEKMKTTMWGSLGGIITTAVTGFLYFILRKHN